MITVDPPVLCVVEADRWRPMPPPNKYVKYSGLQSRADCFAMAAGVRYSRVSAIRRGRIRGPPLIEDHRGRSADGFVVIQAFGHRSRTVIAVML